MGISAKSWGRRKSIEKKLENKEMMAHIKKIAVKASEQETATAPKGKAATKK